MYTRTRIRFVSFFAWPFLSTVQHALRSARTHFIRVSRIICTGDDGAPPDAMRSSRVRFARRPAAAVRVLPASRSTSLCLRFPRGPLAHRRRARIDVAPRTLARPRYTPSPPQLHVAAVCKGRLDVTSPPDGSIRYPGVRSSSYTIIIPLARRGVRVYSAG